ncbi:hypothetical protein V8E51_019393 [Hyaloscypha variabilis]
MDRASRVLAQGVPPGVPTSYYALADHHGNVSHSTLHYRARGRPYPIQMKFIPLLAYSVTRHRPTTERPLKAPNLAILAENMYNIDETRVILSMPGSIKVLISKYDRRDYRGARVKRITVTAIEYISGDGRYLNLIIIWPYTYSDSRYIDSKISLEWLNFGMYETLEILEFYFENDILLYRLPSYTSYKLQPYNIAAFTLLKAAYRVNTISKEYFTSLYSPTRGKAFTLKNIKAGFAISGLFPFNPDRVLRRADKVEVGSYQQDKSSALGVRRSTKSLVLGKAKVISYEDLEEARAKRVVKDSAQVAKGKGKRGRKSKCSPAEPEEGITETARRGRKRKSAELETPEPTKKMTRMSNVPKPASASVMQASRTQIAEDEVKPQPWRAPVA